jgi:flagellar motor protein MotB
LDKLGRLAEYLRKHPNAYVRLTGYADRDTGTPTINQRLSRERSAAVSKWLQNEGIAESRIRRFAKGDTVQPFDLPEDNRVTVCFVYNPDEDDDGKSYPY